MTGYTHRYQQLVRQAAYARSVQAHGLSALLAPYTLRLPYLPQQRAAVPTNAANHAV